MMTTKKTVLSLVLVAAVAGADTVGPLSTYLVEPCRLMDTRESPRGFQSGPLVVGDERPVRAQEACGVPFGAKAVIINVTVTDATDAGYLMVLPGDYQERPRTSGINFQRGLTLANSVTVRLGALDGPGQGFADLFVVSAGVGGEVHVIIDVVGYLR